MQGGGVDVGQSTNQTMNLGRERQRKNGRSCGEACHEAERAFRGVGGGSFSSSEHKLHSGLISRVGHCLLSHGGQVTL